MKHIIVYAAALLASKASGQKSNPYLEFASLCTDATNSASSRSASPAHFSAEAESSNSEVNGTRESID